MEKFVAAITVLLFSCTFSISAEEEKQIGEIKALTERFWKQMTSGKFTEAKKSVFTQEDDSDLDQSELFAKMVSDEFESLVSLLQESKEEAKAKEITVKKIGQQRGRNAAYAILMVWEPEEREYEKLTIAWLKTKASGWKIVDL